MAAKFAVSWDSQKAFYNGLIGLQQRGDYVDMTVAADGHFIKVHQLVLALSSPYFGDLIKSAQIRNNGHPIIFLNGISHKTLTYLLEYMYTGEVCISIGNLVEFMEAGKNLLIRGIEKLENPLLTVQERTENLLGSVLSGSKEYNIIQVGNQSDDEPADITPEEKCIREKSIPAPNMEEDENMESETSIQPESILPSKTKTTPKPVRILPKPSPIPTTTPTQTLSKDDDISGPIQGSMQYTISNKGSLQMIFNRFIYYAKYTRKSQLRQWRCVDYLNYNLKCPAYIVTKEEAILKRVSAHNHIFHDQKILKKIRAGAVYTTINECETKKTQENKDSTIQYTHSEKINKSEYLKQTS